MSDNTTQLLTRGYFGETEYQPFGQQVNIGEAWAKIKKSNGLQNVELFGSGDTARAMLTHRPSYPSARNDKAAWAQSQGAAEDFEEMPEIALLGQGAGLLYKGVGPSEFLENGAQIPKGGAHSVSFLLPKPDAEYPVWFYRWGGGDARWSFEVIKGNARVVRLLPTWTRANEAYFWILKAVEEPTTEQSTQMESLEPLLYADSQSVEIDSGQEWYGNGHNISFLPGSAGVFSVRVEGGRNATDVDNSAHKTILETRAPTDDRILYAWPLSQASVGCSDGNHGWRVGAPVFATSGAVRLGVFPARLGIDVSDIAVTARGTANGGTLGGYADEINVAKHEIVATIEGDGTSSPALSSVLAFAQGGARIGTDTVTLDTDEHTDKTWIMDMRPTFEKEGRRTSVEVDLFMMNGALSVHAESGASIYPGLTPDGSYNFMQSRLADAIVNGHDVLKRGRIAVSTVTNVRGVDLQNMPLSWGNPDTHNLLTVVDGWDMVDGHRVPVGAVGDGMMLGAWLRLLLGLRGCTASDMAGIDAAMETELPTARGDGPPAVFIEAGDDLGAKLTEAMELYGYGRILSCRKGVWTAGFPSTEVKAIFERGDDKDMAQRALGINRIFDQLDLPNDYGDTYNVFPVIGGNDVYGRPIIAVWKIFESISNPASPYYIGYEKWAEPRHAPGLRTRAQVNGAARSYGASKGKPGKFMQWRSWWIDNFFPGDRYIADSQLWELDRICDASTADDRMMNVGRRVYLPSAGRLY